MRSDIEKIIHQYYAAGEYVHPFQNIQFRGLKKTIRERRRIYDLIGELRSKVERKMEHVALGEDTLAEMMRFHDGAITLRLSFLGSFAHVGLLHAQSMVEVERGILIGKIYSVLEKFECLPLTEAERNEVVPWLTWQSREVTVGQCLFGKEEE